MSNRVNELEAQIAELRAAVNGLTEELVETKDRVRELESAAAERDEDVPTEREIKSDDHVVVVEQEEDDVAVATDSPEEAAEAATDTSQESVEPEEPTQEDTKKSTDDIIVA